MTLPAIELSSTAQGEPQVRRGATARPDAGAEPAERPGVIVLGGAQGAVAVARSLGRKGIPVWFVGSDHPIARFSRYTRRHFNWPGLTAAQTVDALCALAEKEGLRGWVLFPAADAELQLVARNHARLSQVFQLFTMPWGVLEQVNDKARLHRVALCADVAAPRVYEAAEIGDGSNLRFPVIIKPRSSENQNALTRDKAWRIDNPDEFRARAAQAAQLVGEGNFLVQEMVPGDGLTQFSYAALWDRGKEVSSLVVRRSRQFPSNFGTSPFVETIDRPEIAAVGRRLLVSIGFHGLVEMDFKFDARDGLYKPLDVNTRVWAWIGLGAQTGHDFPWSAYLLATGHEVLSPARTRPGRWVYVSHNLLSVGQQLRREKKLDASAWRSLFMPSLSATFAWDDPLPGVAEFPVLVPRLFKRIKERFAAKPPKT